MSDLKTNDLEQYVTAPEAVTIDRYNEMLNVLPPENWRWLSGFLGEYFQLSEYYAGNVTTYFVQLDDSRCFTFRDSAWLNPQQVLDKIADVVGIVRG
ncbi:MAG: hypothetical protein PHE96_00185 [Methylococcales bacterium]|nr:hypothetical protein [Methylococcales bacterium]